MPDGEGLDGFIHARRTDILRRIEAHDITYLVRLAVVIDGGGIVDDGKGYPVTGGADSGEDRMLTAGRKRYVVG
jgi:hypothetical protein